MKRNIAFYRFFLNIAADQTEQQERGRFGLLLFLGFEFSGKPLRFGNLFGCHTLLE